jgi:hypothetical protein
MVFAARTTAASPSKAGTPNGGRVVPPSGATFAGARKPGWSAAFMPLQLPTARPPRNIPEPLAIRTLMRHKCRVPMPVDFPKRPHPYFSAFKYKENSSERGCVRRITRSARANPLARRVSNRCGWSCRHLMVTPSLPLIVARAAWLEVCNCDANRVARDARVAPARHGRRGRKH